jgi:hypothetical protein
LEAAQIWRELAPHYFPKDCFGGSSNLEGTGSTLFSGGLFWKFGFTNLRHTVRTAVIILATLIKMDRWLYQIWWGGVNW